MDSQPRTFALGDYVRKGDRRGICAHSEILGLVPVLWDLDPSITRTTEHTEDLEHDERDTTALIEELKKLGLF